MFAALAGAALAAALSFLIARSIARPIRRIAAATRALAADKHHEPLPQEGTTEVASLAQAFNEMTQQLDASREAERNFLLSVSHELKTPLTAIRGYAEGLADGAFDADEAARIIGIETGRLERLVRDLLDLARMNRSEFAVRNEPVDLAEVAREAVRRHEAAAKQFRVALDGDRRRDLGRGRRRPPAADRLEPGRERPPRDARRRDSDRQRCPRAADRGRHRSGIAPGDLPHVFERFYLYDKVGKDRPVGSGLGLAIVQQLARAMGGDVSVESGVGGTTFAVRLRPQLRGVHDLEVGTVQRA